MTLQVIRKNSLNDNTPPKVVRTLEKEEEAGFLRYFADRDNLMSYNKSKVLKLADEIYMKDHWLMCGCNTEDHPIFRINKSIKGTLYICHLTKRGEHYQTCPLRYAISEDSKKKSKKYVSHKKKSGALNLLTSYSLNISDMANNDKKSDSSVSKGKRRSKLSSTLFRILDDAGANTINYFNAKKPYQALKEVISTTAIIKKIPLSKYFYYFDFMSGPNDPIEKLSKDTWNWPSKMPKYALMLANVTKIEGNILHCTNKKQETFPIHIIDRLNLSSGRFGKKTGPYMALIMYCASSFDRLNYLPRRAFVIPRYKEGSLIPIDSNYERLVLKGLIHFAFKQKKQGILVDIEKPLFDIDVMVNGNVEQALPDFIITSKGKTLVLEVNGSIEETYLERKQRTHEIMSHYGELISFNAIEAENSKEGLDLKVKSLIKKVESILC